MDEITRDTEVLSLTGQQALDWHQEVGQGRLTAPANFQWQSLAQGSALRARIASDAESMAWAELSTTIYDRLADESPQGMFGESGMYCRVAMIERHGAEAGDKLRDPAIIFDWFRAQQPTDLEGTLRLIQRLTDEMSAEFETEIVAPLRDIKSRLNVIRALPNIHPVPDDVSQFMKLYGELP